MNAKKKKKAKTQKPKAQKKQTPKNRGVMVLSGSVMLPKELRELKKAKRVLEQDRGLSIELIEFVDFIGKPLANLADKRPTIKRATRKALKIAVNLAVKTMDGGINPSPSNLLHRAAVTITGGAGGAIGLPGVLLELPATTVLMFRSIADIARGYGEDITKERVKMECLTVFALGGKDEGGYFELRRELAGSVAGAAKYLSSRTSDNLTGPALVQLIEHVVARFSVQISQKAAAQVIPIAGAAIGMAVNNMFIDHFQKMARVHFFYSPNGAEIRQTGGAERIRQHKVAEENITRHFPERRESRHCALAQSSRLTRAHWRVRLDSRFRGNDGIFCYVCGYCIITGFWMKTMLEESNEQENEKKQISNIGGRKRHAGGGVESWIGLRKSWLSLLWACLSLLQVWLWRGFRHTSHAGIKKPRRVPLMQPKVPPTPPAVPLRPRRRRWSTANAR